VIRGELVNLRAVDRHDAADLHRWLNNPDVMCHWGLPSSSPSLTDVQRQIEGWLEGEAMLRRPQCLIIETLEAEPIGFVALGEFKTEARSTELSMLIGEPTYWGRRYGSDALNSVIAACFDDWNIRRVWARTEAFNERAQRMFRRCGFAHEATLRDASFFDGQFHDVLVFGLVASDRCANSEAREE